MMKFVGDLAVLSTPFQGDWSPSERCVFEARHLWSKSNRVRTSKRDAASLLSGELFHERFEKLVDLLFPALELLA